MQATLKRVPEKHTWTEEEIKYDVMWERTYIGTIRKMRNPEDPAKPWQVPFSVAMITGQRDYPTRKAAKEAVLATQVSYP